MHLASYSTKCFQVDHAATAFGRSGRLSGASSVQVLTRAKFHGWLSDETAMRLLFKFAGEDISAHEEMARIRAERAEERKAGIIQPLPTSDLLDIQEIWHGQNQTSKLSQKGQINPLFAMMITNGGHDNNISTSRKGKREDGNEHPIRLFSKRLNKDYSNRHSIARTD